MKIYGFVTPCLLSFSILKQEVVAVNRDADSTAADAVVILFDD